MSVLVLAFLDKQAVLKTSNPKYLADEENIFIDHELEMWNSLENNTSNVYNWKSALHK